jgi:superfamily II DNA/RNA helicase
VINMDLPWNPAVLEQRIGRIHRLGQYQPVRVVNFIAQGTIEHGMLSLLSFKQSLFSGVLDKGKDEVFLGGTRLKRFMDSVDKATHAIPVSMPQESKADTDGDQIEEEGPIAAGQKESVKSEQQQAWNDVISAGAMFIEKLGRTLLGGKGASVTPRAKQLAIPRIEIDETTGQQHIRIPMPNKETIQGIVNLLNEFSKKL